MRKTQLAHKFCWFAIKCCEKHTNKKPTRKKKTKKKRENHNRANNFHTLNATARSKRSISHATPTKDIMQMFAFPRKCTTPKTNDPSVNQPVNRMINRTLFDKGHWKIESGSPTPPVERMKMKTLFGSLSCA